MYYSVFLGAAEDTNLKTFLACDAYNQFVGNKVIYEQIY